MRILIVEDESGIARMLTEALEDADFTVTVAADGDSALRVATDQLFHLVILDLMLPVRDGWSVCKELRARRSRVPILMLTARDGVNDRVIGLDLGADDYLAKPFDIQELLARVRALLRRDKMHRSRIISIADLEIDCAQRRVWRSGREIQLSHREYDLMEALAANEGKVLTRETIQERIWMNEEALANTVNVYVGMLRKKIDAAHEVKLIQTIHGVGYTLLGPKI